MLLMVTVPKGSLVSLVGSLVDFLLIYLVMEVE